MAPPSMAATQPEWHDLTAEFAAARASMAPGEMIHTERFTLLSAMSAIELMDPKMDVGCGVVRDLNRIALPPTLTDRQVINIMDHLLACETTWLDAHTLAQTVFSCVYTHRLSFIPSPELFSFVRVQLATMDQCINVILDEKVAEEEDFVNWTSGFRFPHLNFASAADEQQSFSTILSDARARSHSANSASADPLGEGEASALVAAIVLRLDFRFTLYRAVRRLVDATTLPPPQDTDKLLERAATILTQWQSCPFRSPVDDDLITNLFDPSINRHQMMATPPRTAPLMGVDAALAYYQRIISELRAALALRGAALRPILPSALPNAAFLPEAQSLADESSPRYSLQVALFAIENFGAKFNPRILTRSVLSRLLIPQRSVALFADPAALIPAMFRVDMEATAVRDADDSGLDGKLRGRPDSSAHDSPPCDAKAGENADIVLQTDENAKRDEFNTKCNNSLQEVVTGLLDCMLRNRSRLRRQLLRALQWLDQFTTNLAQKRIPSVAIGSAPENKTSENEEHISQAKAEVTENGAIRPNDTKNMEDTSHTTADTEVNPEEETNKRETEKGSATHKKSLEAKVANEICCRLMALHWLLGFEVELYEDFEYVAVYFYVWYVLTCLGTPSRVLSGSSGDNEEEARESARTSAALGIEVHPAREALACLDDGRRWLCRALSTFLHALSDAPQFSYSCERGSKQKGVANVLSDTISDRGSSEAGHAEESAMFGSEKLWFEQRFGALRGVANSTGYAGHGLFRACSRMQEESLLQNADGSQDIGQLRLEYAASAFQEARLFLGLAKKKAERCEVPSVAEEAWQLAAVAVKNSVAVARAIAIRKSGNSGSLCKVTFQFSKHKHFAIVGLSETT